MAHRTHDLGWEYVVFDVPALRPTSTRSLADVEVHAARATGRPGPGGWRWRAGATLTASVVIDAAGRWQPLNGTAGAARCRRVGRRADRLRRRRARRGGRAAGAPRGGALHGLAADHGEGGWPTFLYGIPVGAW
jgi:lycopene beta-cyclase